MIADRWGVTDAEVTRRYPCDDAVPDPAGQLWRGVTVNARPRDVWPWLTQIRVAPYSYDWVDNLGRRSPQELLGLPEPAVGDHFSCAGGRRLGTILSAEPQRQLTGRLAGAVMSYVLEPESDRSRLLLKINVPAAPFAGPLLPLLSLADLVMARRQLLNLKRLAERRQQHP
ncbi:polyketide cyclase [Mycolicibacterium sp. S2-37]|uniref:polyketide cyclase n=1 Tax=Mycolicibacterium sp. S2-37 TaxID=2810297 RepID=UPI001A93AB55|nr:polyketide cyclase [Mycolicibacterium sp. S2-37]MBO0676166.1 polyketide cyclase [Mycolicibacterium sp. S2-37]